MSALQARPYETPAGASLADGGTYSLGDLCFHVQRSRRRRTLQITVERDGELVLSLPEDVSDARVETFVSDKRFWVYTKLAEKARLQRLVPLKEFVDGEGFLYLGRSYRLRLVDAGDPILRLVNGRFLLPRQRLAKARELFVRWYNGRARLWLEGQVALYRSRIEVAPAGVKVQDLSLIHISEPTRPY